MLRRSSLAIAVGAAVLLSAPAADARSKYRQPTLKGATAALKNRVDLRYYREMVPGDSIKVSCKRIGKTRREIQYQCKWRIQRGSAFDDGYLEGSGYPARKGTAIVFGKRNTPRKHRVRYRFLSFSGSGV